MDGSIDTRYRSSYPGSPFDAVAERYDEEFEASPITHWLRSRIYTHIQRRLRQGSRILDLACGTGTDAIELARRGYSVVGIDRSPAMVDVAKRKAGQTKQVEFLTASYEILSQLELGTFNLVLSNFGGLNCTQHLEAVMSQVVTVTQPGGYFLGVLMPPFALWEALYALRHREFQFAVRRRRGSTTDVHLGGTELQVCYYSVATMKNILAPWYTLEEIAGLNILVPPPALKRFVSQHPRLVKLLCDIESYVAHLPILRAIGDHYLIVAHRRPEVTHRL